MKKAVTLIALSLFTLTLHKAQPCQYGEVILRFANINQKEWGIIQTTL